MKTKRSVLKITISHKNKIVRYNTRVRFYFPSVPRAIAGFYLFTLFFHIRFVLILLFSIRVGPDQLFFSVPKEKHRTKHSAHMTNIDDDVVCYAQKPIYTKTVFQKQFSLCFLIAFTHKMGIRNKRRILSPI